MQLTPERLGLTQLVLAEKEAIAPRPSHLNPPAPQQNHSTIAPRLPETGNSSTGDKGRA